MSGRVLRKIAIGETNATHSATSVRQSGFVHFVVVFCDLFHRVVCGDVRFAPGQNDFLRAPCRTDDNLFFSSTAQLIIFRADEKPNCCPWTEFTQLALVRPSFRGITNRIVIALNHEPDSTAQLRSVTQPLVHTAPFLSREENRLVHCIDGNGATDS
jgi:hypothetical protein